MNFLFAAPWDQQSLVEKLEAQKDKRRPGRLLIAMRLRI
jgi:hypothetical protein